MEKETPGKVITQLDIKTPGFFLRFGSMLSSQLRRITGTKGPNQRAILLRMKQLELLLDGKSNFFMCLNGPFF